MYVESLRSTSKPGADPQTFSMGKSRRYFESNTDSRAHLLLRVATEDIIEAGSEL